MQTARNVASASPMTAGDARTARKKYFVNPRLQWQLVLGANVLALISVAMLMTIWYYSQTSLDSVTTLLNIAQGHRFLEQIAARQASFTQLCVIVGAIQFVLFNVTAVFLSHRIAGPLYRLERHLEQVGDGSEPRDVKFRKGDLYQELAQASNKVMARVRGAA